jgi:hypothetical protein
MNLLNPAVDGGRVVTVQLFTFDELSPEARKKAIREERKERLRDVQQMALAYAEQQFFGAQISSVSYPYAKVAQAISDGEEVPQVVPIISFKSERPRNYDAVVQEMAREIPSHLTDDKIIANIKADDLEYLIDGTLWLYGDKEGS